MTCNRETMNFKPGDSGSTLYPYGVTTRKSFDFPHSQFHTRKNEQLDCDLQCAFQS